jgi:hypothetical protein
MVFSKALILYAAVLFAVSNLHHYSESLKEYSRYLPPISLVLGCEHGKVLECHTPPYHAARQLMVVSSYVSSFKS